MHLTANSDGLGPPDSAGHLAEILHPCRETETTASPIEEMNAEMVVKCARVSAASAMNSTLSSHARAIARPKLPLRRHRQHNRLLMRAL